MLCKKSKRLNCHNTLSPEKRVRAGNLQHGLSKQIAENRNRTSSSQKCLELSNRFKSECPSLVLHFQSKLRFQRTSQQTPLENPLLLGLGVLPQIVEFLSRSRGPLWLHVGRKQQRAAGNKMDQNGMTRHD